MSSLKDQLSQWKQDNTPADKAPAPTKRGKAGRVGAPAPGPVMRAPAPVVDEPEQDDASLFADAVADIGSHSEAILSKYDAAVEPGALRPSTSQEGAPVASDVEVKEGGAVTKGEDGRMAVDRDKMAFLDAVGEMDGASKGRQLKKK